MIIFLMPIAQPPNITRKSDMKGMIQWLTKSKKKSIVREGSRILAVPERHREPPQLEAEYERDDEPEPHVRRGGQDVADRQNGVVEPASAGGDRARLLLPMIQPEQDGRNKHREGVRGRAMSCWQPGGRFR